MAHKGLEITQIINTVFNLIFNYKCPCKNAKCLLKVRVTRPGSQELRNNDSLLCLLYKGCWGIMDGEVHRSLISLLVKRSSLKAAILGKGEIRFNTH